MYYILLDFQLCLLKVLRLTKASIVIFGNFNVFEGDLIIKSKKNRAILVLRLSRKRKREQREFFLYQKLWIHLIIVRKSKRVTQKRKRDSTDDKAVALYPGDPGFKTSRFLFMLQRALDPTKNE